MALALIFGVLIAFMIYLNYIRWSYRETTCKHCGKRQADRFDHCQRCGYPL